MNTDSFERRLDTYAELLVRVGVNVQPGQKLIVRTSTAAVALTRKVVELAYRAGSPYVEVMWSDDGVTRARFAHAPDGSFGIIPQYRAEAMNQLAAEGAASLSIVADDPNLLAGTDPRRYATYTAAWRPTVKAYTDLSMSDSIAWCVAAAASPAWATRAYPHLAEHEAVDALWNAIFAATRVDAPDPVAAWREHATVLKVAKDNLNSRRYSALRFTGPGTDLTVGLADGHVWDGGSSTNTAGTAFMANMPTEEVFTAPHRAKVDGVVRATKPLSYNGTMIDGFWLRFENGRVVEAHADVGQAALDSILDTDEGSRRLGEVALVPASSPIEKAGVLFYQTLFDENAACHIALGRAYNTTVAGSRDMSPEQQEAVGMNTSLSHVDFMIGSAAVDVDGVLADGTTQPVMRRGEWAD
jgi:aminopeptidase